MDINEFTSQWPYCFHVTFAVNLEMISMTRCLYSANTLLSLAGQKRDGRRRIAETSIRLKDQTVVLRNQRALDPRALELPLDYKFNDYITFLNERVYFWPGTSVGPVADGIRLLTVGGAFMSAAIIRIESRRLLKYNENGDFYVATRNTGATWRNDKDEILRPFDCLFSLAAYSGDPRDIVEVSFPKAARLPKGSEYSMESLQKWQLLSRAMIYKLAL